VAHNRAPVPPGSLANLHLAVSLYPGGRGLQKGKEEMEARELAQRILGHVQRLTQLARILRRDGDGRDENAVRELLAREATMLKTRATGKGETMSSIKFTNVPEFLEELNKDRELVDRGIVRITKGFKHTGPNGLFISLDVIASAKVGEDVVVLTRHCGQFMQNPNFPQDPSSPGEEDAQSIADTDIEALEKGCSDLGMETRAGFFDEE